MTSIWNDHFPENRLLFRTRFPELAGLIGLDSDAETARLIAAIPESFSIEPTPAGQPTLRVNGIYVHSRYNPLRDAERALEDADMFKSEGCLFAGCGLAYTSELYTVKYPDSPLVLLEPDIFLFLLCLAARPLASLLNHPRLIVLIGTPAREASLLLDKLDLNDIPVYAPPALTAPNRPWFDEFEAIRKRNREKKEINSNTLKRFGGLWLRNMCRNLTDMRDLDGIGRFAGTFANMPVLVLAAGPSLDRILPHLAAVRDHCLIIAVDTAVRACVRSGVEPDFIVLVDPQYWNFRHLDGLSCPNSILIAESAVWPPVFRFRCRAVFLCSSLFPLGKFLEERTERKGELGAGGSVSTTAWDFARHLGSKRIVMAALDLGFPDKKTHFTGSIFEERAHVASGRLSPAETAGYNALYGAGPFPVPDYRGSTVLTDKRLILYAWWFESRLAEHREHCTATLTPEGVRIPGFSVTTIEAIIAGPKIRPEIDRRLAEIVGETAAESAVPSAPPTARKQAFDLALTELKNELSGIVNLANRAIALCDASSKPGGQKNYGKTVAELERIDRKILESSAKEIAAMVFPTEWLSGNKGTALSDSRLLYGSIRQAAEKNLRSLDKYY